MKSVFREIKISLLVEDPTRAHRDPQERQTGILGQSIISVGLINPVVVRRLPRKGNYFGVISGWTRVLAAKNNGETTIWCKVMRGCSDELAEEIGLRANTECWRTEADQDRDLGKLVEYYTEKEQELRALNPVGDASPKPGRPASPENAAIKKAAAEKGLSRQTVKRRVKSAKNIPSDVTAAGAGEAGEMDATDAESVDNPPGETHAENSLVQASSEFASSARRFGKNKVERFRTGFVDAGPDDIAQIPESDINDVATLIDQLQKLLAAMKGRENEDEKKVGQPSDGAEQPSLDPVPSTESVISSEMKA
jgi:ParB-like chromosome segregation protein Spo0J